MGSDLTWNTAHDNCERHSARLTAISNEDEMSFIHSFMLQKITTDDVAAYIGKLLFWL